MGWDDNPEYTPQFKWRYAVWGVLISVGIALIGSGLMLGAGAQEYDEGTIQACACDGLAQEVQTPSGTYVDCMDETHAIEIESTDDWAEAIGQSLHYAEQTGKRAKVLFFCEAKRTNTCYRHQLRFEETIAAHSLPIDWEYVPDQCITKYGEFAP